MRRRKRKISLSAFELGLEIFARGYEVINFIADFLQGS
jgi:hypothetical protein